MYLKKSTFVITLIFILSFFCTAQDAALTNEDVLQMVQSGLSEDLIKTKIKSSKSKFDTSPAKLTELKQKGISDNILVVMIEAGTKSTVVPAAVKPDAQFEAARSALKALRRLNSATDVGISYINYSPLVAEVKAEVEDSLPKISNENLKQQILSSMNQYEFAAAVWQAFWRSDFIEGDAKEIAVKQYGVQKKGWLKVVWRNDFLAAIWARAQMHFRSADRLYSQLSINDNFSGAWKLIIEDGGKTLEVYMSVNRQGEDYTASFRTPFGNSTALPVEKKDDTFSITYSVPENNQSLTLSINSSIADNKLRGTAIYNDGHETKTLPFSGSLIIINK